jgi:site-specific recombinase XerD
MENKIGSLLQEFESYLQEKDLSQNTIDVYVHAVSLFWEYQGNVPVTEQSVQAYVKNLKIEYCLSTANLYSIALNQYLIWSKQEKYCIRVKGNRRKKRVENVLNKEEYTILLDYLQSCGDDKYYTILKTLAGTGIRISELQYITTDTICMGVAEVHNKGKTREIYIGKALQKELDSYCKRHQIAKGAVFLGNNNTPITRGAVNQKLVKIAEACGVDKSKVHPHAFRHLFAKEYMMTYQNIAELSCVLGHESIETTMIYLANSSREYIERVSGLDL